MNTKLSLNNNKKEIKKLHLKVIYQNNPLIIWNQGLTLNVF